MTRVLGTILLVALVAPAAFGASAHTKKPTKKPTRLTHCVAVTHVQGQVGLALFKGTCNGAKSSVKVQLLDVTGRLGGLLVSFKRSGATLHGKLGTRNSRLTYRGRTFRGNYGPHRVKFTVGQDQLTVAGRVGAMRVLCTVKALIPLGERITCTGRRGGAAVLFPYLALLYAAP
ncbi:MAG: hypothetical protein ACJ77E_19215 [Gaiellaceae bacterium]